MLSVWRGGGGRLSLDGAIFPSFFAKSPSTHRSLSLSLSLRCICALVWKNALHGEEEEEEEEEVSPPPPPPILEILFPLSLLPSLRTRARRNGRDDTQHDTTCPSVAGNRRGNAVTPVNLRLSPFCRILGSTLVISPPALRPSVH